MAKRNSRMSTQSTNKGKASSASTVESVDQRVVALAEQVGRIVGTVQAKAEGWLEKAPVKASSAKAADATSRSQGRSGGIVDAPGKKHRKAPPSTPGTKHSDTRIAKMKVVNESRRRGGR